MPAKDIYHGTVKNALTKEEWQVTHDPLFIQSGGADMYIDLGAEHLIAAEKVGEKIAVEIKSFIQNSFISEFHLAIGQYINYRLALKTEEPERTLYLAVSSDVAQESFLMPLVQAALETNQIKYLVYDIETEMIIKWKK
jgi:hypothetical protein